MAILQRADVASWDGKWIASGINSGNGTVVAIQSSWYDPAGASDDWMITPKISVTEESTLVRWEAKAIDIDFKDGYQVLVSTTNDLVTSFKDTLFEISAEDTEWVTRRADLKAYAGQDIYIAFRNNSNDKFALVMDNIWVGVPFEDDALIQTVDLGCASPPGDKPLSINIENKGRNDITSFDISYTLNSGTTITRSLQNINIPPGGTYNYSFPQPVSIVEGDDQNVEVVVSNINGNDDPVPSDNTTKLEFDVVNPTRNFTLTDTKDNEVELFQELKRWEADSARLFCKLVYALRNIYSCAQQFLSK